MVNSTGNVDKKSTKTGRKDKTKNEKENATHEKKKEKITVQLQEINQKVLAKQERLKRYRRSFKNRDRTVHSKTTKENSINNWEEMTRKHTNNRMQKKRNGFKEKYSNRKTQRKGQMVKQHDKRIRWA